MKCYWTGEECDCGNDDMETACPHDDLFDNEEHLDELQEMRGLCPVTHSED